MKSLSIDGIRSIKVPTHLIISNYLGKSLTMVLYQRLFYEQRYPDQYLPLELKTLNNFTLTKSEVMRLSMYLEAISRNEWIKSVVVSNPYKQIIGKLINKCETKAKLLNSINLIIHHKKNLNGFNIDGEAFWQGLGDEIQKYISDILLFGAGGVSSAVGFMLASHNADSIGIFDTDFTKAQLLGSVIKLHFPSINVYVYKNMEEIHYKEYSLIYNGTGLGKYGNDRSSINLSPLPEIVTLPKGAVAIDSNYTPWKTKFLTQCEEQGLETHNGFSHMVAYTSIHLSQVLKKNISYSLVYSIAMKLISNKSK